jgi:uncharacterized protein YfaS (alpha-2-macroglobulin family)
VEPTIRSGASSSTIDELMWHVTDDRQMYRPGEEVHVKGWLRLRQGRKGGDVAGLAGQVSTVELPGDRLARQ